MNYKCNLTRIILNLLTDKKKAVLSSLASLEGSSISSISKSLLKSKKIPPSTTKSILKKFKKIGIVQETNGSSSKLISLTPSGKVLIKNFGGQ